MAAQGKMELEAELLDGCLDGSDGHDGAGSDAYGREETLSAISRDDKRLPGFIDGLLRSASCRERESERERGTLVWSRAPIPTPQALLIAQLPRVLPLPLIDLFLPGLWGGQNLAHSRLLCAVSPQAVRDVSPSAL
ncbi:hypothetical protein AAFF_G00183710 [Aldrovandia affinis]|uniref:Uncharacterized protein n=1 Tax=Aldrovandia affinis TaxID=143900 RepID=A0AAD7RJV6_9TELE|nr:hypothetical protein AAFF_G00183710 [Aldrovandia affinis]